MKRVILAAMLCNGCLLSGKGDGEHPTSTAEAYSRYAVMGDSASGGRTFISLRWADKSGYCSGDSVQENVQKPFSQEYRLSGNALEFWISSTEDNTDTSLQLLDQYVRKAAGSGLQGEWVRTGTRQRAATVPVSEPMRKDWQMRDSAFLTEHMVITRDSLFLFYDRLANTGIWDLILNHSQGMRTEFHGKHTVVFTKTDGTWVTVSEDAGDIHAVSSRAQDSEYVQYAFPKRCPVDVTIPDWYNGFFGLDAAAKRAAPMRDGAGQR
jgi:hypothetical protein